MYRIYFFILFFSFNESQLLRLHERAGIDINISINIYFL
jgi:hypothetical protein